MIIYVCACLVSAVCLTSQRGTASRRSKARQGEGELFSKPTMPTAAQWGQAANDATRGAEDGVGVKQQQLNEINSLKNVM